MVRELVHDAFAAFWSPDARKLAVFSSAHHSALTVGGGARGRKEEGKA